jgi:hypothetical protein
LYTKRDKSQELFPSNTKTVAISGLAHGDMIYLFVTDMSVENQTKSESQASSENGKLASTLLVTNLPSTLKGIVGSKIPNRSIVEEDNVDLVLQKMDGLIKRKRDPKRYRLYQIFFFFFFFLFYSHSSIINEICN